MSEGRPSTGEPRAELPARVAAVDPAYAVTDLEALGRSYPDEPSSVSLAKEVDHVTPLYAQLIAASPFCVVATVGEGGLDCSPRGDGPGFVEVLDARTLVIPDRRGNNRLDTLRNLIRDSRIGLIFLVPGRGECVRVRGTATVSTDPALLARHAMRAATPASCIVVAVERVYFQCARAMTRSGLWDPRRWVEHDDLPTAGMLTEEAGGFSHDERVAYDDALADRQAATLY